MAHRQWQTADIGYWHLLLYHSSREARHTEHLSFFSFSFFQFFSWWQFILYYDENSCVCVFDQNRYLRQPSSSRPSSWEREHEERRTVHSLVCPLPLFPTAALLSPIYWQLVAILVLDSILPFFRWLLCTVCVCCYSLWWHNSMCVPQPRRPLLKARCV